MKNGGNVRAVRVRRSRSWAAVVVTASFVVLSFALFISAAVEARDPAAPNAVPAGAVPSGSTPSHGLVPDGAAPAPGARFVRFHVVGHSDRDDDQRVKLHVRDRLLAEMQAVAEGHGGWWRVPWEQHVDDMAAVARDTLKDYGFAYGARGVWRRETAPSAEAGGREGIVIRILLGEGAGANWWCVLFPPLCFVDAFPDMEIVEDPGAGGSTRIASAGGLGSLDGVASGRDAAPGEMAVSRGAEDEETLRIGLKVWAALEQWRDRAGWHHRATSLFEQKTEEDRP